MQPTARTAANSARSVRSSVRRTARAWYTLQHTPRMGRRTKAAASAGWGRSAAATKQSKEQRERLTNDRVDEQERATPD
jgi:hypothetical protein